MNVLDVHLDCCKNTILKTSFLFMDALMPTLNSTTLGYIEGEPSEFIFTLGRYYLFAYCSRQCFILETKLLM